MAMASTNPNEVDESAPLLSTANTASAAASSTAKKTKSPSYKTVETRSSSASSETVTASASASTTNNPTEDEGRGSDSTSTAPAVGDSHDKKDSFAGDIKSIISVLLLGEFIANTDTTLVFASAGKISSEFAGLEDANWLSTSYSLGVCLAQPIYGKLSDTYGRKPLLLAAYLFFSLGCLICGFGKEMWQVILGRAISGIGGAGSITVASVIITDLVPKRDLASWRAYINIAMTLGRSLGGPTGGWLTDSIGWRWLFLIQAPFFWLSILLTAMKPQISTTNVSATNRSVNDQHEQDQHEQDQAESSKLKRIDFLGMTLITLSTASIILLLDTAGNKFPWSSIYTLILAATATLSFLSFILVEAYIAREPVFPLRILRQPNVLPSYLVMSLQLAAQVSLMYSIPLYFQITTGASATNAGAHLVPAVAGNAVSGLATGAIIRRTGRFKTLAVIAGLIASITYVLLYLRWNGINRTGFGESLYIIPGGIGTGMAQATVFVSMTSLLDSRFVSVATGGLFLFSNLGLSVGITACNSMLDAGFRRLLVRNVTGEGAEEFIDKVTSNVHYISSLKGHIKEVVIACYAGGLKQGYLMSLGCSLVASVIALTIRDRQL